MLGNAHNAEGAYVELEIGLPGPVQNTVLTDKILSCGALEAVDQGKIHIYTEHPLVMEMGPSQLN